MLISSWMDAVVHFAALILFGGLIFKVLKYRKDAELLAEYLQGRVSKRVQVDWPLRFFSSFCSALKIPFEGRGRLSLGLPKRLRKEVLFETLLLYGIDAIEYRVGDQGSIQVSIKTSKRIPNREALEKELRSAFSVDVSVCSQFLE